MSEIYCVVCLLTLSALWSPSEGDAEVSCVFSKSCILPCSFHGGTDAAIRWIHVTSGKTPAYVRFNNHDQAYTDQYFTDRTSLFKDQISGGNASLLLTRVEVHDQGRYKCSTSTISGNEDSFINLTVDAPVHEVDIQQVENRITCSSEGIYPQPELIWSTSPPSNVIFKNTTTVQPTEEQLYNISSCLILSDSVPDLDYSCTISTRRSKREATLLRAHTDVSCIFMKSCILPCSFQGGINAVIHWNQVTAGNTPVHSYYHNQDQLAHQNQRFRGRTSLFKEQISGGNASLQLTGLEVQDQGRYKCSTSTISGNKDSFISLNVDALVGKVNIQQVENIITCSSEGIYPEPRLFWSTSPPSNVTFRNTTTVQQTEQQLYNIKSSLIPSDNHADLAYSCNISTRRSTRRATLRQQSSLSSPSADTTIPCGISNVSLAGFSLVWTFNHSEVIVKAEANVSRPVSEGWRQRVKGVSESGGLTLRDLSPVQEGIYTCELSNEEETYIINTLLRKGEESQTGATGIIVAVVVGVVIFVVLLAGLLLYYRHKKSSVKKEKTEGEAETGV